MIYLVIGLIALGILAALIHLVSSKKEGEEEICVPHSAECAVCIAPGELCEQEQMMKASVEPVEYFDDEELDKYKERASDKYTEAEVDEFSKVLYTMRAQEVKDWNRSLILRGINLPNQLKDEVIMLIQNN